MRKTFLGALVAALLLPLAAVAQPPPPVTLSANFNRPTFSAVVTALAPAASATDWLIITGSATKTIEILEVECAGISTANASQPINGIKRSTAATGGTSTAPTAVPHNSNNVAATATLAAYTANPTAGTLVGTVRSGRLTTNTAATSTIAQDRMKWTFGQLSPMQPVTLFGAAQAFALNGGGASYSAGSAFSCHITWDEY